MACKRIWGLSNFIVLQRQNSPAITKLALPHSPSRGRFETCVGCFTSWMSWGWGWEADEPKGYKWKGWDLVNPWLLQTNNYVGDKWEIRVELAANTSIKSSILYTARSCTQTHNWDLWKPRGKRDWFDLFCWVRTVNTAEIWPKINLSTEKVGAGCVSPLEHLWEKERKSSQGCGTHFIWSAGAQPAPGKSGSWAGRE